MTKKSSPSPKKKISKEERRAKYTAIARARATKKRDRNVICFQCRRRGHSVADCPQHQQDAADAQGGGGADRGGKICYRCGSQEHSLSRCPERKKSNKNSNQDGDEYLPFATCFVCKEKGHLSSKCPRNEKGVYIRGGCCKECGSKKHRIQDCPIKKEKEKKSRNDGSSSDDSIGHEDLLGGHGDALTPSESRSNAKSKANQSNTNDGSGSNMHHNGASKDDGQSGHNKTKKRRVVKF